MDSALPQIFGSQLGFNMVAVYVVQLLKNNKSIPFVSDGTSARLASLMMSAVGASGLTVNWTMGDAGGTLTIANITISTVLSFLWYVFSNYATQKVLYKGSVGRPDAQPPQTTP